MRYYSMIFGCSDGESAMFGLKVKFIGVLAVCACLAGCGAYQLDEAQLELRSSFARGDYNKAVDLIQNFEKQSIYQGKDLVLLNLEHGTAHHFAGNYAESSAYFTTAEHKIDDLFSKSISRAIQSFLVNDTVLDYDGEDYEDIYINLFKCLNYIHLNNQESALVEARRIAYKLNQLDIKYKGLVEALSQADTTNTGADKWKTGQANVQKSTLGHYLATILFAKTHKPDDARIEFENLKKAFAEHEAAFGFRSPSFDELGMITEPTAYNVLVNAFTGRSPMKSQNDLRLYFAEIDTYLKFSLPVLNLYDTKVHRVEVLVNGSEEYGIPLIEEMDIVAQEVYKVKEPIIYARTIVRTFLKAIAANKLKKSAEKEDEVLGLFVNALGKIAQETTEKADLRSWQTMPGKAYAQVLHLPLGTHHIQVRYYNNAGFLLHTEEKELQISEQNTLNLIESIYWN